ncbi:hypothetical protein [Anoxybacteroides rupiense]|uniref:hypothetical protein n=1 Tax=Anoxybacteroides rupiense TaxID=311460 RepID=UPI0016068592|nr:hypothetical protein [Anoxybacillus rupiensis]MBB3908791.1 hypothetical protein [Anoxybacillus rupiensis]
MNSIEKAIHSFNASIGDSEFLQIQGDRLMIGKNRHTVPLADINPKMLESFAKAIKQYDSTLKSLKHR